MIREREIEQFMRRVRSSGLLDPKAAVIVSRAPGRLDVMGGIADYSGSLVLQQTIHEATFVALQRVSGTTITITSLPANEDDPMRTFSLGAFSLLQDGEPLAYERGAAMFSGMGDHWVSYVIGVFLVLMHEQSLRLDHGMNVVIGSSVPEGKGVASSAALEVAVMQALAAAFHLQLDPRESAVLCQKAENLVAGAPCGVMDQMTSMCGEADALLALVCQPAELLPSVPIPPEIQFWGIDSGERHAVSGSDYGMVRTGAFMGLRILSEEGKGNSWNGYLANIRPDRFEAELRQILPEEISGAEFLRRFSETSDTVTKVDPNRLYKILQPAAHPIHENERVKKFRDSLLQNQKRESWSELGELMYESHRSYSECGLGSRGTDLIVRLVRKAGPSHGLFGARITGGGSGGTVVILGRAESTAAVGEIARKYESVTGHRPHIFEGSSPGAAAFGTAQE